MAYLGVKDKNEYGVYYFSSISVRDAVGEKLENPVYYLDRAKKTALEEFKITEKEIKDGSELIRKYIQYYIGLMGTPFDGVYAFNFPGARDKIAKNFEGAFISNNKEQVLKEFGAVESDIKDGAILYGDKVNKYLIKKAKETQKSEFNKSNAVKTEFNIETDVSNTAEVVENKEKGNLSSSEKSQVNLIKRMIDEVKKDNDVVELTFSNGSVYRLAIRDIFYVRNGVSFQNCANTVDGKVVINSNAIDKLIDNGDIINIKRTVISHADSITVCMGCDDEYSPNVETDEHGRYEIVHFIPKVVLNANEVVSVRGMPTYSEISIDFVKMEANKHKLVFEYLRKKYN